MDRFSVLNAVLADRSTDVSWVFLRLRSVSEVLIDKSIPDRGLPSSLRSVSAVFAFAR